MANVRNGISRFLDLPAELRIEIYELLLGGNLFHIGYPGRAGEQNAVGDHRIGTSLRLCDSSARRLRQILQKRNEVRGLKFLRPAPEMPPRSCNRSHLDFPLRKLPTLQRSRPSDFQNQYLYVFITGPPRNLRLTSNSRPARLNSQYHAPPVKQPARLGPDSQKRRVVGVPNRPPPP